MMVGFFALFIFAPISQAQSKLAEEQQTAHDLAEIHREQHSAELVRMAERKDVDKERELLALRTEFQNKLQQMNEDSTAKIQSLYERIELIRKENEEQTEQIKKAYEEQIAKSRGK